MGEVFLDSCTEEGRLEIRKRLAVFALLIQKQPRGKDGVLIRNDNTNIAMWVIMTPNKAWAVHVDWRGWWNCEAGNYGKQGIARDRRYLTRNNLE